MQNYISKFKIFTNIIKIFLLFIFSSLLIPSVTHAASLNLSGGSPSNISNSDQEYQVNTTLNIDASDGTEYYLRGVFYLSGTNNYCGYTWNGSSWFNGPYTTNEGWKNLLKVTVSSSSANTTLKAKLDLTDNGCKNSGSYNFKVQRFTQGGSGTFDSQNEQSITVSYPTSTPTNTPVPTAVPASSPSNTPAPSNTPKPQDSPAPSKTPVPSKKPGITTYVYDPEDDGVMPTRQQDGNVLGESTQPTVTSEPIEQNNTNTNKGVSLPLLFILILGGVVFMAAAVVISTKQTRRRRN